MATWTVNWKSVNRACDTLGISEQSAVCITRRKMVRFSGRIHSSYFDDGSYGHRIVIDNSLDYREASRTIWHELTHAAQVERMGLSVFNYVYDKQLTSIGITGNNWKYVPEYDNLPMEVEARQNEQRYRNRLLVHV